MLENKSSRLNPLASSFIPGKFVNKLVEPASKFVKVENKLSNVTVKAEGKVVVEEVAEKYVMELLWKIEANCTETVTKEDLASVVGQLITIRFNADKSKINSYLSSKVLCAEISALKPLSGNTLVRKASVGKPDFDLTSFQVPDIQYLIIAFWGLYRHEQAERPLLSLTCRSDQVTNKVWSISSCDKKLWNPSCVDEVCDCPPMFGYILPNKCFERESLNIICSKGNIHLNHYPESLEGNEYILTCNRSYAAVNEQAFNEDVEDFIDVKMDMESMTNHFEKTVTDICNLLTKHSEVTETVETETGDLIDYRTYFWDDEIGATRIPFEEQKAELLVDDNEHPLLESLELKEDEGISLEIEEMIRRSLSPKKEHSLSMDIAFEDFQTVVCDPPCSIWCNSAPKEKHLKSDITFVSTQSGDTDGVPSIDLLSSQHLEPQKHHKKFSFVDLKPVLDLSGPKISRPLFRRAFSVNDCDPNYYDMKLCYNEIMAQASNSKDLFTFLKKDPVNFFKTFNRSNSWKDTDSGFVSNWSSQEDIYGDKVDQYREQDDRNSMWGLFSGEDSLWKPLPECTTPNGVEEKPLSHKRVRDLRRQRSLN